jgi:N-acetylneuraminic acid mutarotase
VGVVNGKIYVVGGWLSAQAINTVEEYDPVTNTWATKSPMPVSLAMTSAAAVGGNIYVFGGYDELNGDTAANLMYAPAADSWVVLPNMLISRDRSAAAVVDGKIYVVGGRNGDLGWLDLTQRFDPNTYETYEWVTLSSMPTSRGDLAAAAAGGQIFAFGGRNTWTGPVLNVNEALDLTCGGNP